VSDWLKGKLLVALPAVAGDEFFRTVILVLAHGPQGALGVVLNRPTTWRSRSCFPISRTTLRSRACCSPADRLSPTGSFVWPAAPTPRRSGLRAGVGYLGFHRSPPAPPGGIDLVRVYRGYAGWEPRQLERELERGSWLVLDARPGDLTAEEPTEMWDRVLERGGPKYARVKNVPRDPSVN